MSWFANFRDFNVFGKALWWFATMFDRCLNLLLNGDFRYTLSAYLGKNDPNCGLCNWLSKYIEPEHCVKAAKKEGLLK